MKTLINFFSSVKLAIFLLILITAASILGTLIPQGRTAVEYAARYGQMSPLLTNLELTNLYHSWWYAGLLSLFALNILVCTLTRLSPKLNKVFHPGLTAEAKSLKTLKTSGSFKTNWTLDQARENLTQLLRSRHYKVKEKTEENKTILLAQKKRLGLFGPDMVHIGLLVIIIGGIISGLSSFRTTLFLSEGETLAVPTADFKLRLDKFETIYYASGGVRDWKSRLTVVEGEQDILTKTIEVNHPLSYGGIVFYQSEWGWDWENSSVEIWVKKQSDPDFLHKERLPIGSGAELLDDSIQFTVLQFIPDFIIGENGRPGTRSLNPNNPAVFIEGTREGETIFSGWVFALFPDFTRIHATSGEQPDLTFEFKDFEAGQYSGIQMARDPGVNWIWLGCALLMAGLFVVFYWPSREIKAVLEGSADTVEITAGGTAAKNKEDFQTEFESIMTSIRRLK